MGKEVATLRGSWANPIGGDENTVTWDKGRSDRYLSLQITLLNDSPKWVEKESFLIASEKLPG